MHSSKYYDRRRSRPLDLEEDGCDLERWRALQGKAVFARHPSGFLIFLSPDKIEVSDEYKAGDPYTVVENLGSPFHQMRIECTLQAVGEALQADVCRAPRILDLGCGEGHITAGIKEAWPDAEVSGLDYAVSAIERATEWYPGIDFIVADAYEPPYRDDYFDVVVCNNLWEHVPDPLRLVGGISDILRPGGWLVISTPSRYRAENVLRVARGIPVRLMSKHHVTEYSVGQVMEQLRYAGFRVVRSSTKPLKGISFHLRAVRWLCSPLLSLVGSHHRLECTVFFLAQSSVRNP